MGLEDYLFVIKRIAASVSLPLSVDFEAGYGDTPEEISAAITRLSELGVAGINIEDSVVVNGKRSIVDAGVFAEKIQRIIKLLDAAHIKMFINVRSDSFLLALPNALEDALLRVDAYQNTGAHGLFFPCIKELDDIAKVTSRSKLPVNVMCIPGLPDFKSLQSAGVKRISMGPFLNMNVYQKLGTATDQILTDENFTSLF
jgi:2-methylisocitrate lyase-like PEP mutase family enzyme